MPLGFERINERTQRPNANINFIKPLPKASPNDQKIAKDFLERIAAQCFPVMRKNYLYVMALEEFPANNEFLGRNFNAGEVIQLVLKDKAGRWLSFKFVQMVMMHELAHCKQMNHSRFFWKERNAFAEEMQELWKKGYVGEGLWGRGTDLMTGQAVLNRAPEQGDVPEHLCGGTYRRRGRKRKRGQDSDEKTTVTYAERQQKRIAKKFGKHGQGNSVGDDEFVRGALEVGKRHAGKPTVAKSKRGRELRANAALARFEAAKQQPKQEEQEVVKKEEEDSETDWSDEEDFKDSNMIQVCGDEGEQDEGGQNEMDELRLMSSGKDQAFKRRIKREPMEDNEVLDKIPKVTKPVEDSETESEDDTSNPTRGTTGKDEPRDDGTTASESEASQPKTEVVTEVSNPPPSNSNGSSSATICPICSLENDASSPICMVCSNVLMPSLMKNHWRCKSSTCKDGTYINPGDAGRCGVCGGAKPKPEMRPVGVVGADVLRWD